MSYITDTPHFSPPRKNSFRQRRYLKISEANIDNSAVIKYLQNNNYHKTLKIFKKQAESKKFNIIIQIIRKGAVNFHKDIDQLLKMIKKQAERKNINWNCEAYLTIQFYLHVWYCLNESTVLNKVHVAKLKQYIALTGSIISNNAQILPYFALPYSENPALNPKLKIIFTSQWKENLITLVSNFLQLEQKEITPEQEWINIIKDMINICNQIVKEISLDQIKRQEIHRMIERVHKYESVFQYKQQRLKKQNNVQFIKSKLQTYKQNSDELSYIKQIHIIQLEIVNQKQKGQDKQFVRQLVNKNILFLNKRHRFQLEELKLIQMLSSYFIGRNYFANNIESFTCLPRLLVEKVKLVNAQIFDLQIINSCLQIFQKLCIRSEIFECLITQDQFISSLIKVFDRYLQSYDKGNLLIEHIFVSNMALIMNITLHNKGRDLIVKTKLFEKIVKLTRDIKPLECNHTLQSLSFSIIYLLLVDKQILDRAEEINLKKILLDKMIERNTEYYVSIVQYIIKRLEGEQNDHQQEQADIDRQSESEYDETIEIDHHYIWFQQRKISVNAQNIQSQNKVMLKNINGQENIADNKSKFKSEYSQQKYDWKNNYKNQKGKV